MSLTGLSGLYTFSYMVRNNLRIIPRDVPISQMEGKSVSEQDSAFSSVDGTSGLIPGLGTLLPLSHVSKPNLNGQLSKAQVKGGGRL